MTIAQTKSYVFSAQDLAALLVHYTDGLLPLNGEVKQILVHPQMTRKVVLVIESDEWETETPLFLSYDGNRIASWTQGDETPAFRQLAETPNRQ